ncbi:hypothetical protein [Cellulomonas sp. RIT-PI-Y]|uniref:hypothetical protein n=1 Tax=Cellulomonas sp. RIT-PI-Y TaxID=3035297 RepID=UPI0021DB319D|nr:hypothetical protein [Cellulomonas sp. RIT-PI-Y]
MKRSIGVTAVLGMACLLSGGAISPAIGSESSPTTTSVTVFDAAEPTIRPAAGETVVVHEGATTTTYVGVTAACTETVTAGSPTKSGSIVMSTVSFARSAGCSPTTQVATARLWSYQGALIGWRENTSSNTSVIAGGKGVGVMTKFTCKNSNATQWRSGGFLGSAGNPTYGASVTLSCGG